MMSKSGKKNLDMKKCKRKAIIIKEQKGNLLKEYLKFESFILKLGFTDLS